MFLRRQHWYKKETFIDLLLCRLSQSIYFLLECLVGLTLQNWVPELIYLWDMAVIISGRLYEIPEKKDHNTEREAQREKLSLIH